MSPPCTVRPRVPCRPLDSPVISAARLAVEFHLKVPRMPPCRVVAADRRQLAWLAFDALGPRRITVRQRDEYVRDQYRQAADAAAVFIPGMSVATIAMLRCAMRQCLKHESAQVLAQEMWRTLVHEHVHLAQSMRPGYREDWLRVELHNLGQRSRIMPKSRVARYNQVIDDDEIEADAVEEALDRPGYAVFQWMLIDLIREVAQ